MTVVLVATEQDVYPPRVQLAVTGLTVGDAVELYRVVGGDRTAVRGGSDPAVADTAFVRVDAELPFGVPVSYAAVVNGAPILNANPFFESSASPWTAVNGPVARSTAHPHQGSAALLLTPNGTSTSCEARSENVAATVALSYTAQVWLFCAVARSASLNIIWRNASGGLVSTSVQTVALSATTWTSVSLTAAAPASTTQAQLSVSMGSTPPATNLLYIDEAELVAPDGTYEFTTAPVTYALPGGKVALSDAVTGLAAEVVVTAWPDKEQQMQVSTFQAGGRNIAVIGPASGYSSSLDVFVETTAAVDNVTNLLRSATSGIIQIRQPGGYDGVDAYVAVTGWTEHRFSQDGSDPRRTFTLAILEVDGWAAALRNRGFTLQDIADAYTGLTLADLANDFTGRTLLDVALADWGA